MSSGLDALRVAQSMDIFWCSLHNLKALGRIITTCKTIRCECDLHYAVKAMNKDRKIQKVWAERWLGVAGWRFSGIPTLLMGLSIVAKLGGMHVTWPRAIKFRLREQRYKDEKAKTKKLSKKKAEEAEKNRRLEFLRRLNELKLPTKGFFFDMVTDDAAIPIDDTLMDNISKYQAIESKHELERCQRKKIINKYLAKHKIAGSGYYYDKCVWNVNERIDAEMMGLIKLRSRDSELRQVVEDLHDRAGHYFKGIYEHARNIIDDGSYLNDAGHCVWRQWDRWAYDEHRRNV
jgi:hypothetical protein